MSVSVGQAMASYISTGYTLNLGWPFLLGLESTRVVAVLATLAYILCLRKKNDRSRGLLLYLLTLLCAYSWWFLGTSIDVLLSDKQSTRFHVKFYSDLLGELGYNIVYPLALYLTLRNDTLWWRKQSIYPFELVTE